MRRGGGKEILVCVTKVSVTAVKKNNHTRQAHTFETNSFLQLQTTRQLIFELPDNFHQYFCYFTFFESEVTFDENVINPSTHK